MNMMLPFLVGHFRCFLINTRGRGLSADNNDHSRERMYDDVVAFADSIGEPTILFGHSSGATWVLGAISRSRSCVRAALYEPALPLAAPVITDEAYQRFASALGEGRAAEAALLSLDAVVEPTDDERALFSAVVELTAPVLPAALRELPELNRAVDDASIAAITVPVALLHGTRSAMHFQDAIRFLEDRLNSSEVDSLRRRRTSRPADPCERCRRRAHPIRRDERIDPRKCSARAEQLHVTVSRSMSLTTSRPA